MKMMKWWISRDCLKYKVKNIVNGIEASAGDDGLVDRLRRG